MATGRKTGGRKKGTPNREKKAMLDEIQQQFPDYHPVIAMAKIANDGNVDLQMRFYAHKEIAHYVEPKRKAIEVTGGPVQIIASALDEAL